MAVDRIKHTKPASRRTFLDELEPIPYEITEEELAKMDPRMKQILFGITPVNDELPEENDDPVETEAAVRTDEPQESPSDAGHVLQIVEPEPAPPDYTAECRALAADFPPAASPTITLIFPVAEDETEIIQYAHAAAVHNHGIVAGRRWYAARFGRAEAESLRRLNDLLGEREGLITLVNDRLAPYGRGLWLPMMFIFTAGRQD